MTNLITQDPRQFTSYVLALVLDVLAKAVDVLAGSRLSLIVLSGVIALQIGKRYTERA